MNLSKFPTYDHTNRRKLELEDTLNQLRQKYQRSGNTIKDLHVVQKNIDLLLTVHKEAKDTTKKIEARYEKAYSSLS